MTIKKLPDARFSQEKKGEHQIGASSCVARPHRLAERREHRKEGPSYHRNPPSNDRHGHILNHPTLPLQTLPRSAPPACPTNPSALLPTLLAFSVLLNLRALYRSPSLTTWDGSASTSLLHTIVGTLFKACRGLPCRRALIASLSWRGT